LQKLELVVYNTFEFFLYQIFRSWEYTHCRLLLLLNCETMSLEKDAVEGTGGFEAREGEVGFHVHSLFLLFRLKATIVSALTRFIEVSL
jgi:hypothetical protein